MLNYEVTLYSVTAQITEGYCSSNLFPPFSSPPLMFYQLTRQSLRTRLSSMGKNQNKKRETNK